jgi:hypothetical protein
MGGSWTHEVVVEAWRRHVVDPLLGDVDGSSVHTFLCFHANGLPNDYLTPLQARKERTARLWRALNGTAEVVLSSASSTGFAASHAYSASANASIPPEWASDYPDQFARMDGCLQAMRSHEHRTLLQFTHVIKARPDLFFWRRIPRMADLDPESVSLRARAAIHSTPIPMSRLSFSTHLTCDPRNFLMAVHTAATPACPGRPSTYADVVRQMGDGTCERSAVGELRRRLRDEAIETCALYDDQLAVMPRKLADAYLELEPSGPDQPSSASFLSHAAAFDVAAIRRTLGSQSNPDSYVRACPLTGVYSKFTDEAYFNRTLGWRDTFVHAFRGGYSATRQAADHAPRAVRGVCCEPRLTWRLVGRLVPVSIVPLHVASTGTHAFLHAAYQTMRDDLAGRLKTASVTC